MNLITHPRSYFETSKRLNDYKKGVNENWDIILPPTEVIYPNRLASNQTLDNWGNDYLNIDQVIDWFISNLKRKVAIGVIDTAGVYTNQYLTQAAWNQFGKIFTNETDPTDLNGHSTHCGGIIGAIHPEHRLGILRKLVELGYIKLIPLKALTHGGSGQYAFVKNAVEYFTDVNLGGDWVKVISMSLGGGSSYADLDTAMVRFLANGGFLFASAGNSGYQEGTDRIGYPGNSSSTLCIGSIDKDEKRSSFSSVGQTIDFTGPGRGIWSTYKGNTIASLNGTSMSNPQVVGIGSLLLSVYPDIKNQDQLKATLKKYATDLNIQGWDKFTGWGSTKLDSYRNITIPPVEDDPVDEPPVDEPPVEEPVKPKRTLVFPLEDTYTTIYGNNFTGSFKKVYLDIEIEIESTRMAEYQFKDVKAITNKFFTNRGFVLFPDSDLKDAGYWITHFFEMIAGREVEGIKIKHLVIKNEDGVIVSLEYPKSAKGLKTKMEFTPETFEI